MTNHRKRLDETCETLIQDLNNNLANPDLDPNERARGVALYFKLSEDIRADEKLALDREKIAIEHKKLELDQRKLDLLEKKIQTGAEIARIRAEAPKKCAKRTQPPRPDDPPAPYGHKPDGSPYTHAEFCNLLDQAVADIYGFDLHTGNPVPRVDRHASTTDHAAADHRPSADGRSTAAPPLNELPARNHPARNHPARNHPARSAPRARSPSAQLPRADSRTEVAPPFGELPARNSPRADSRTEVASPFGDDRDQQPEPAKPP